MTLPHSLYGGNAVRVLRGAVQAAPRKLALALLCSPAWAQDFGPNGTLTMPAPPPKRPDVYEFRASEYPGAIAEFYYLNHADRGSGNISQTFSLETERGSVQIHVSIVVTGEAERVSIQSLTDGWFPYPDFQQVRDGEAFIFYLVEAMG